MTAWSTPELVGHVLNRALTDRLARDVRTVKCGCGAEITAPIYDPGPEVRRHNATIQHVAWWERVEEAEETWQ